MTEEVKATPTPAERIITLTAEKKSKFAEMVKLDPDSKEALDAVLEIYKIGQAIKTAEAEIKSQEAHAAAAEKRNSRVKLVDDMITAHAHVIAVHADKKSTLEEKNAASDAYKGHYETIVNEIIGSRPAPAKVAADGTTKTAGTKGATSLAIREAFIANRATGMSDSDNVKAIIASGQSRGTTGAVVLAYQREIGEKE